MLEALMMNKQDKGRNIYFGQFNNVYKMNSNGEVIWSYSAPTQSSGSVDTVQCLATDNLGYVHVGYLSGKVRLLNPGGNLVWEHSYNLAPGASGILRIKGIAVDIDGSTVSVGGWDNSLVVTTPNRAGGLLGKTKPTAGSIEGVAVAANKDIYTVGENPSIARSINLGDSIPQISQTNTSTGEKLFRVATSANRVYCTPINSNSVYRFATDLSSQVRIFNRTGSTFQNCIFADEFNNVYNAGSNDDTLRKMSIGGNVAWEQAIGEGPSEVFVDPDGYVYVAGYDFNPNIMRFTNDGVLDATFETPLNNGILGFSVDPGMFGAGFWN